MPQQRQVYGKSVPAYKISSCFGSDSPIKPKTQNKFSSKSLQEAQVKRKPLQEVDLNSRLQALSLDRKREIECAAGTEIGPIPPIEINRRDQDVETQPRSVSREPEDQICTEATCVVLETQDSSPLPSRIIDQQDPDESTCSLERKDHLHDLRSIQGKDAKTTIRKFADWGKDMGHHFNIEKIAEATYGEVYRLRFKREHATLCSNDESVLKVIALQPPISSLSGDDARQNIMSSIDSVISEVRLLQRMTSVPGFVNFRDITILRGRPGLFISTAWKAWNKLQPKGDKSQFPDPSKKSSYSDDQLWAVIEMQDAGSDLEKIELPTVFHVWDVFWNVAVSLAKAEEECRFEHRDLHLGNICARSKFGDLAAEQAVQRPRSGRKLGYTALETTIIDYTLSRADLAKNSASIKERELSGEGRNVNSQRPRNDAACDRASEAVACFDLSKDSEIFGGNAEDEYQYEVYRMMRSIITHGNPIHHLPPNKAQTSDDEAEDRPSGNWKEHHPLTNILWLHFILETMLNGLHYWPSEAGKDKPDYIKALVGDPESSATARKEAANLEKISLKLEKTLRAVREMLLVENMQAMAKDGLTSASDLVWLALEEKWLNKQDVEGSIGESG